MRSLVAHDVLVFVESDDLSKTLISLTKNKNLKDQSAQIEDFSFLKNVQLAIAVDNFETSENKINEKNSVINFKPQFVAVAETRLWQWQAVSLVKNQLHNFIVEKFRVEASLKEFEKDSGRWFEWTAKNEQKAFAFVVGGRIYFANNKDSILKCFSVSNGRTESLKVNESLDKTYKVKTENNVAFGFISPNGVAHIADYISIPLTINATESEIGRSFIISVLPKIMHNITKEFFWTATELEGKITDNFSITAKKDFGYFLITAFSASKKTDNKPLQFVPPEIFTVTRYNLPNPSEAWRNLLATIAKNTESQYKKVFLQVSNNLLYSYAIADANNFLGSVDSNIFILSFDSDNEKSVLIAAVKDSEQIKKSIVDQINFRTPAKVFDGAQIWESKDENVTAAFVDNYLVLGDSEKVYQCLLAKNSGKNFVQNHFYKQFSQSKATAVTFGTDSNSAKNLSIVLGGGNPAKEPAANFYLTETSPSEIGFERKTVSDFGLLGKILEQLK